LERINDPEKSLKQQLKNIKARLVYDDDYIPVLIPMLGCNVAVPSAFGCEIADSGDLEH